VTRLELIAVEGLPEVRPGDDLGELISARSTLDTGDVLVIAQKVVSKSEGRLVNLHSVKAGEEAVRIATQLVASPDPRMVQVVLDESVRVLRSQRVLITETRHGFVCANGGVDHLRSSGDSSLRSLCRSAYRRGSCEQLAITPEAFQQEVEATSANADSADESPEEFVARRKMGRILERALADLPSEFRETLLLVDVHELDYQEVAIVLDIPLGTVKTRTRSALSRLADLLEGELA